jgi:hypothetical protein
MPERERKPPSLLTKLAARLAVTSYVPDADCARFQAEGILALHENIGMTLRQKGPYLNRYRKNRACLVVTNGTLAVYEGAHNLVMVATSDPGFEAITAGVDGKGRLELDVPMNTGTSIWSQRAAMTIRLKVPGANQVAGIVTGLQQSNETRT